MYVVIINACFISCCILVINTCIASWVVRMTYCESSWAYMSVVVHLSCLLCVSSHATDLCFASSKYTYVSMRGEHLNSRSTHAQKPAVNATHNMYLMKAWRHSEEDTQFAQWKARRAQSPTLGTPWKHCKKAFWFVCVCSFFQVITMKLW